MVLKPGKTATSATKSPRLSIISWRLAPLPERYGSWCSGPWKSNRLRPQSPPWAGGAAAPGERRKGLDTLFALVSWQLWKERNARCFRSLTASIAETLHMIKIEADRWIEAGAQGLRCLAQR